MPINRTKKLIKPKMIQKQNEPELEGKYGVRRGKVVFRQMFFTGMSRGGQAID
jgi:hypothetical protein